MALAICKDPRYCFHMEWPLFSCRPSVSVSTSRNKTASAERGRLKKEREECESFGHEKCTLDHFSQE